MFLDLLDTVKTSTLIQELGECEQNRIQGEAMLYYLLLMGMKPTLTLPQILDSNVIINIAKSKYKKYFYELIDEGEFRVALYGNYKSIRDYFCKMLEIGTENNEDTFFNFSSLPFLNEYPVKIRSKLQKKILGSIQNGCYNINTSDIRCEDTIFPEHIEQIENFIEIMEYINIRMKKNYIVNHNGGISLITAFNTIKRDIIKDCDEEMRELFKEMDTHLNAENRRTVYYKTLMNLNTYYQKEKIDQAREIVDCAYNIAVASHMNDNEGISINIPKKHERITQSIKKLGNDVVDKPIILQPKTVGTAITWEYVCEILKEVRVIECKGDTRIYTREQALKKYTNKQTIKPIVEITRYIGQGVFNSYIPGMSTAFEFVDVIFNGAIVETLDGKLKKQSCMQVFNNIQDSKIKKAISKEALQYMSLVMK